MSLNFLSPWFLIGLLGIFIPIFIHLLTRRHQTHIKFSAVHLLQQAQKRSVKRSRPNRLILLIIRCLGIIALCLALANPIFSLTETNDLLPNRPSALVLILDDSYSLRTQAGDQNLFQFSKSAMSRYLEKISTDAKLSLVLASHPAKVAMGWSQGPNSILEYLKTAQPSYQTTNIGSAITKAKGLLDSSDQENKEIIIFTDRDNNGWNSKNFSALEGALDIHIKIIDVSGHQTDLNHALIESVSLSQEYLTNSRIIRVKPKVKNLLTDQPLNQVRITLVLEGKLEKEILVDVPAGATLEKEFTFPYLGTQPISGYVEIQNDALNVDNRRIFFYRPQHKIRALVVDGDPRGVSHQNETFYIEKALNPFTTAVSDIEPIISTLAELPNFNLKQFSMVVLCNVRSLPFGYEQKLEKFVHRGGALFISLGDQINVRFYNEKMGMLLPVTLQSINQVSSNNKPFRLESKAYKHNVLKVFNKKTLEEMSQINFHTIYSIQKREGREYLVPMRFTNQFPALIESNFGKGKVFLYVSTLDRDWNNFPIQPTFLPWIQRWVKYASKSLDTITRPSLNIGDVITIEESQKTTLIVSPNKKIFQLEKKSPTPMFKETWYPGNYLLFHAPENFKSEAKTNGDFKALKSLPKNSENFDNFVVNVNTQESLPGKISHQTIKELLPGTQIDFQKDTDIGSPDTSEGIPLTTPFFIILASMLLFEGWILRKE